MILISAYTTIVTGYLKNKKSLPDNFNDLLSSLLEAYLDFHAKNKTLTTVDTINELKKFLDGLLKLSNNPLAKNIALSSCVTQLQTIIENPATEEEQRINNLKITENTENAASNLSKYPFAVLMFGYEGFNLYLEYILHSRPLEFKLIAERFESNSNFIFTLFSQNPNYQILKTCYTLLSRYQANFLSALKRKEKVETKINYKQADENGNFILKTMTLDLVASFLTVNLKEIPSLSTRVLLIKLLLPRSNDKEKTIYNISFTVLGNKNYAEDQNFLQALIQLFGLNPFSGTYGPTIFNDGLSQELQQFIFNCVAQKTAANNDNNNNCQSKFSIKDYINTKTPDHLIHILILFAINTKNNELLAELVSEKRKVEKVGVDISDRPDIRDFTFVFNNIAFPNEPRLRININDHMIGYLSYCILVDNPGAFHILINNKIQSNILLLIQALVRALVVKRFDYCDILLDNIAMQTNTQKMSLEKLMRSDTLLIAVQHKMSFPLFKKMVETLNPFIIWNDGIFDYISIDAKPAEDAELRQSYLALLIFYASINKSLESILEACHKLMITNPKQLNNIGTAIKRLFVSTPPNIDWNWNSEFISSYITFCLSHLLSFHTHRLQQYVATASTIYDNILPIVDEKPEGISNPIKPLVPTQTSFKSQQDIANYMNNIQTTQQSLTAIIYYLLHAPCPLNLKDAEEITATIPSNKNNKIILDAFTIACLIGNQLIIQKMLEKEAIIEAKHFCFAAYFGYASILKMLIERNADFYFALSRENMTPLEYAVLNNHTECVKILINGLKNSEFATDPLAIKQIKSAYKLCTDKQINIREFLKQSLDDTEQKRLEEKNPHRIEFTEEVVAEKITEDENNNTSIEKINPRYHRITFFNPDIKKHAVAFISEENWSKVHKKTNDSTFENTIKLFSQSENRFGQRLFSIKNTLKFRGHGDARLYFTPISEDQVKQINGAETIHSDVMYYDTYVQDKHENKTFSK